jgi:hypothetical protein
MSIQKRNFRILLCCDPRDATAVRRFRDELAAPHIEARLLLEDLKPGSDVEFEFARAIPNADLVLTFLSNQSVASAGPLQKAILCAIDQAKQKAPGDIFIIPVRLDDCDTHVRLKALQKIDVFENFGWERLAREIQAHLNRFQDKFFNREEPMPAVAARSIRHIETEPDRLSRSEEVPLVTFPHEIKEFVYRCISRKAWKRFDEDTRRFITTLGCKLEPIIQLTPATGSTLVVGFECLGLGAMGESFGEIVKRCRHFDPGLLRLCLAIAATKSLTYMRLDALKRGCEGAKNLIFSINLDPLMVEHEHFETFLEWHRFDLSHNVIFEINESTTRQALKTLKMLQVEFELRYAADDINSWVREVREALTERVEMTKVDVNAYDEAMRLRHEDPLETIYHFQAHKLPNRPLVLEGIDKRHIRFLEKYWEFPRMGYLYGQGQSIEAGPPWEEAVFPLKPYGCAGGSFIRRRLKLLDGAEDADTEEHLS